MRILTISSPKTKLLSKLHKTKRDDSWCIAQRTRNNLSWWDNVTASQINSWRNSIKEEFPRERHDPWRSCTFPQITKNLLLYITPPLLPKNQFLKDSSSHTSFSPDLHNQSSSTFKLWKPYSVSFNVVNNSSSQTNKFKNPQPIFPQQHIPHTCILIICDSKKSREFIPQHFVAPSAIFFAPNS